MTDNAKSCFLDSNLWLYFLVEEENSAKLSIVTTLVNKNFVRCSVQVVNEVSRNMLDKFKKDKTEVQEAVEFFYRKYQILQFTKDIILHGLELRERYQFRYWDSLIVAAALACECEILYSEDFHDGLIVEDKLQIINPFKHLIKDH